MATSLVTSAMTSMLSSTSSLLDSLTDGDTDDGHSTGSQWIYGALVSMIGSICSNFGVNIQKYSFMQEEIKKKESDSPEDYVEQPYFKNPVWCLGLFLVIFGSLGDFVALGLAAQSIVAPIGSMTLVANIFFAHFWLHEELSKRDVFGTFLIVAGAVLAAVFGDHTETEYSVDDLIELYKGTGFIVYAITLAVITTVLYVTVKVTMEPLKYKLIAAADAYDDAERKKDRKAIIRCDAVLSILEEEYKKYDKLHPFIYCTISGIFGGQNVLFGKMVAELIGASFEGNNQMDNPLTYVFLICMLISIFTQLHFLAKALAWFDALYVVPVFTCFYIVVSVMAGSAYFGEFDRFAPEQAVTFCLGLTMTLVGVYLLSSREMSKATERLMANDDDDVDVDAALMSGVKVRKSLIMSASRNRAATVEKAMHGSIVDPALVGADQKQATEKKAVPRKSMYARRQSSSARGIAPGLTPLGVPRTARKSMFPTGSTPVTGSSKTSRMYRPRGSIMMDNLVMIGRENPLSKLVDKLPSMPEMTISDDLQHRLDAVKEDDIDSDDDDDGEEGVEMTSSSSSNKPASAKHVVIELDALVEDEEEEEEEEEVVAEEKANNDEDKEEEEEILV